MPYIVIDNPVWDNENPDGWGGPEYIHFDVYSRNEREEKTLQRLTLQHFEGWFRFSVKVKRKGNDLYINYTPGNNRNELNRYSLGERDFVWGLHILHNVVRGTQRGSSTWRGGNGPGWEIRTGKVSGGRRNRTLAKIWEIQREDQSSFRQQLLALDRCCAISEEVCEEALEAAHIVPARAGGREILSNGILLRVDLHRLFDSNPPKFEICPETGQIVIAEGFNYGGFDLNERQIEEAILQRVNEALHLRRQIMG